VELACRVGRRRWIEQETLAPQTGLPISARLELGPAMVSSSSCPGLRPLAEGNYSEAMREGERSTTGGRPPLRDGGVCILPLFADGLRRSSGDSLRTRFAPAVTYVVL
jgi:hypothetical protein